MYITVSQILVLLLPLNKEDKFSSVDSSFPCRSVLYPDQVVQKSVYRLFFNFSNQFNTISAQFSSQKQFPVISLDLKVNSDSFPTTSVNGSLQIPMDTWSSLHPIPDPCRKGSQYVRPRRIQIYRVGYLKKPVYEGTNNPSNTHISDFV